MATRFSRAGWLLLACVVFAAYPFEPVFTQDARSGRELAQKCVVCHGSDGIAVAPNAPNLAGENAAYIVTQLQAFRSGKRKHEQMSLIASDLEDDEIKDLAKWYSVIKVVATPPSFD